MKLLLLVKLLVNLKVFCALQDPQAFINDMASIFDGLDLTDIAAHTSEIMQSMMEKIRHHQAGLHSGGFCRIHTHSQYLAMPFNEGISERYWSVHRF